MLKKKGLLIEIEGGEGAGKSTIVNQLRQHLEKDTHVITFREPGGREFSEDIRELFMRYENLSTETYVHLINAQRQENIEKVISPAITKGHIVIVDRFLASTLVYQGLMEGAYEKTVKYAIGYPSVTLLVDTPADVGLKRIHDNQRETNRIDLWPVEKHNHANKYYKQLGCYYPSRYWDIVLNGRHDTQTIDKQLHRIAQDIVPYINDNRALHELKSDLRLTYNAPAEEKRKEKPQLDMDPLDVPVDQLSLPNQVTFALMRSRIFTIRELITTDHNFIQKIPRIGAKSLDQINDAIDHWLHVNQL